MSVEVDDFIDSLTRVGWHLAPREPRIVVDLNSTAFGRYPRLPDDYLDFLSRINLCTNEDQTAWFLCESDFRGTSDSAYAWNEFERQSLEAAGSEEAWKKEIVAFWDKHMPILISVKTGYAYLALRLAGGGDDPIVVFGREPEYEEAQVMCSSFRELTHLVRRHLLKGELHAILSQLL